MNDGFLDGLPDTFGGGIIFGIFVLVLAGLWWLVSRTRQKHFDDLARRREEWEPPAEPDDPRDLPG